MRKLFAICIFSLILPHAAGANMAEQTLALFDTDWQWRLQRHPEFATSIGEHRYDATLTDTSLAACRANAAHHRAMLEQARALERDKLDESLRLSLALFIHEKENKLAAAAFFPCPVQPLTAYAGLHVTLPQLVAEMRFLDADDYRKYIARLAALPAHIDGLVEQLREGVKTGWTAPKTVMKPVPAMLRQLRENAIDGPLGQPFRQVPATIDEEARSALVAQGMDELKTRTLPALQALEDFVRTTYLPAARDSIGASSLPGGADYYAYLARFHGGGELTPAQLHALGLKEVARLRVEAERAIARTGFAGSFAQFAAFANTDKRLFYTDESALLERYRRALARAAAALPRLFVVDSEPELLVKPAPALGAQERGAAWYDAGGAGRPAAIVVNTTRLQTRPIWEVETLALHEGLPGHHLQVSHARSLAGLPPFRRHAWNVAYGEGWALYAESLAVELGLQRDAFSAFGYLNAELLRAARLVADTGIHALGWSRQQALDYLTANTANSLADNEQEVDRYIAWPGQALGYKAGAMKIRALREKAQAALGEQFDVRRFHAAVLDAGPLPLPLLEQRVDGWIGAQQRSQGENAAPKNAAPIASN
jgi:uncharacterized protein (DUF885 family)